MNAASAQRIAQQLMGEARDSAKRHAVELFGAVPPGTKDVGRKQMIEMVQRNWADPSYRQGLATRLCPLAMQGMPDPGAETFLNLLHAAGIIPDPKEVMASGAV